MEEHQSSSHPRSSGSEQPARASNEAFIAASERPALAVNPEQPLSELRVRDLEHIVTNLRLQQEINNVRKQEHDVRPSLKTGKDMGQEQPGDGQVSLPSHEVVNQLAAGLNQMAVNQMALVQELAALRAEVERLKK